MKPNKDQKDFGLKVEQTPLGKKIGEFLNKKGDVENGQRILGELKDEVIAEMAKVGKTSVRCSGYLFTVTHIDKDQLTVKSE